jgi:hypothetical protein
MNAIASSLENEGRISSFGMSHEFCTKISIHIMYTDGGCQRNEEAPGLAPSEFRAMAQPDISSRCYLDRFLRRRATLAIDSYSVLTASSLPP